MLHVCTHIFVSVTVLHKMYMCVYLVYNIHIVSVSSPAVLSCGCFPVGALVMLSPVIVGTLFGTRTLAGLLVGALVSGVQMAVSMSNTGGAWDNAKKYIEVSLHLISYRPHP